MSDSDAWHISALKFHAGERDNAGCFDASLTIISQKKIDEISLLALRLKGRLTEGSSLVMEWLEDGRALKTRRIHSDELDETRYNIFCIKLKKPSSEGRLRLNYYGENDIFIDDYLMISEDQLQDCSIE